jgi:RHS repeat-associated protein
LGSLISQPAIFGALVSDSYTAVATTSLFTNLSSGSVSSGKLSNAGVPTSGGFSSNAWDTLSITTRGAERKATGSASETASASESSTDSSHGALLVRSDLPTGLTNNLFATVFGNALVDPFEDLSMRNASSRESQLRLLSRAASDDSSAGQAGGADSPAAGASHAASVSSGNLADAFPPATAGFGGASAAPRAAAAGDHREQSHQNEVVASPNNGSATLLDNTSTLAPVLDGGSTAADRFAIDPTWIRSLESSLTEKFNPRATTLGRGIEAGGGLGSTNGSTVRNGVGTARTYPRLATAEPGGNPTVTLSINPASPQGISENGGTATYADALSSMATNDGTVNLIDAGSATLNSDYSALPRAAQAHAPPTANPDSYAVTINTPKDVDSPGVMLNDFRPSEHFYSAEQSAVTIHGSVVLTTDGSFTYTPDFGYTGPDYFTYYLLADDGVTYSNLAWVTLDVQESPPVTPTLSINDVSVTEGDSGTQNANFTVTLSQASGQTVTVQYSTANNTATAPSDYTAVSNQMLTIAPGSTSATISIAVVGDTIDEFDETYFVTLSNAVNATIADNQAVGTILDDDAGPTITINDVSIAEGNVGTSNATFTITLSAPSAKQITVNYATENGTAVQPQDYNPISLSTLTFAAGVTSRTVTVQVNGETLVELDETFTLNLSAPTNSTITDGLGVGTIVNDDTVLPTITINDINVTEGNSGTPNATFTVTLSAASTQTVTVKYSTQDGTATSSADYTAAANQTVTFSPSETSKPLTIYVVGETLPEANETFFVNLTAPINATITDNQGQATIIDDDSSTTPSLTINDIAVTEGNSGTTTATFTVTRSGTSSTQITVQYMTANSTAVAPQDYTAIQQLTTLTFAAGATSQTVTVTVNGDTLVEDDETFFVNLSNAVGATIADNQGKATITNDDQPTVWIVPAESDAVATEGDDDTAFVRIKRDGGLGTDLVVNLGLLAAPGLPFATHGTDFVEEDGNGVTLSGGAITIPAGSDYVDLRIRALMDLEVELDEGIQIVLGSSSTYLVGTPDRMTVTIQDATDLSAGIRPLRDENLDEECTCDPGQPPIELSLADGHLTIEPFDAFATMTDSGRAGELQALAKSLFPELQTQGHGQRILPFGVKVPTDPSIETAEVRFTYGQDNPTPQVTSYSIPEDQIGRELQFARSIDTSALLAGRVPYSVEVTFHTTTAVTYSNRLDDFDQINRPVNPGANEVVELGDLWRISAVDRLLVDSGTGDVTILRGDGTSAFYKQENGTYARPYGTFDELTGSGSSFSLTSRDVVQSFSSGLLTSINDHSQLTTFEYINVSNTDAAADELYRVTAFANTASAKTMTYSYDANTHLLSSVTDFFGRTFDFQRPSASATLLVIAGPDPDGVGPLGNTTVNIDVNASGLPTSYTDPTNKTTTLNFDSPSQRVASIGYPGGSSVSIEPMQTRGLTGPMVRTDRAYSKYQDERGNLTELLFDPFGNVTEERRSGIGLAQPIVTRYERDTDGLLTKTTHPDNSVTEYTYSKGRVRSEITKTNTGLEIGSHEWDYLVGNNTLLPDSEKDAFGLTTSYTYTSAGKVQSVTDRLGKRTDYTYDPLFPELVQTVKLPDPDPTDSDPQRPETQYSYNAGTGYLESITYVGGGFAPTTGAPINTTRTLSDFDSFGNAKIETDEDGFVTRREFDGYGRLTRLFPPPANSIPGADPIPGTVPTNYDPSFQYQYDALGRFKKETDPLGTIIEHFYDDRGRVSQIDETGLMQVNGQSQTQTRTRTFQYNGHLTTESDWLNRKTTYSRDALGRVLVLVTPDPDTTATGPVSGTNGSQPAVITTYQYDNRNRLARETNQWGDGRRYVYDVEFLPEWGGSLTTVDEFRVTDPYSDGTRVRKSYFTSRGELKLELTQPDPATFYWTVHTYDNEQRETTTDLPDSTPVHPSQVHQEFYATGWLKTSTDGEGRTTSYRYNPRGWVTAVVGPAGDRETTAYEYNGRSGVRKITEPDPDGIPGSTTHPVLAGTDGSLSTPVTTMSYDQAGRVLESRDPLQNSRKYTYDALGRVKTEVAYASATDMRTTAYDYDGWGRQSQVTRDPLGLNHQTIFTYTATDALETVTEIRPGNAEDPKTSYTYDNWDRILKVTDPLLNNTTFGYQVNTAYGATERDLIVTSTDANLHASKSHYDGFGRLVKETDAKQYTTVYNYDGLDRVTSVKNKRDDYLFYSYDPIGRVTRMEGQSNPNLPHPSRNYFETFDYNLAGQMIDHVDPQGRRTQSVYDATTGRLTDVNQFGAGVTVAYATTSYGYDNLGRVVQETLPDPDGEASPLLRPVTWYKYDALGQRQEIRQSLTGQANSSLTAPSGNGPLQTFEYNGAGELTASVDPENRRTESTYDPLGRTQTVTAVLAAGGGLPEERHTTTMTYNDAFQFRTGPSVVTTEQIVTNPLGMATKSYRDALGQPLREVDAAGREVNSVYDAVGNLSSVFDPVRDATYAPSGNQTVFLYDERNQLQTERINLGTDSAPDFKSRTYAYDAMGNLIQKTDRLGRVTTYDWEFAYDGGSNYRLKGEHWFINSTLTAQVNTFYYWYNDTEFLTQGEGQLRYVNDGKALNHFLYDTAGRLTTATSIGIGLGLPPTIVMSYGYDNLDRRTSANASYRTDNGLWYAAGTFKADFQRGYTYDALSRMIGITQADGDPTPGTSNVTTLSVSLDYYQDGQTKTIQRTHGSQLNVQTDYTYDRKGRVQTINHLDKYTYAFGLLAGYSYTYDAADRVTSMAQNTTGAVFARPEGTTTYTYEKNTSQQPISDQLAAIDYGVHPDVSYTYDNNGNRTGLVPAAGATPLPHTTQSQNRLASDGVFSYVYDAEGNLQTRTQIGTGEVTSFAWDHRNRLTTATFKTSATGSVTKQMQYTYDVFNRRIEKFVLQYTNPSLPPAFAERYFYDFRTTAPFVHTTGSAWSSMDDVVLILHGDYQNPQFSALRTRLLSGPEVDQVFADETAQGDLLWTLADNQGTIRDLANTASQVVNHVYYSAFGQVLVESNTGWATVTNQAPPWQIRRVLEGPDGLLYDTDLGLIVNRGRLRTPSLGRFLTRDPIELGGGDTNVYRDRGNSPTNATDPSGLEEKRDGNPFRFPSRSDLGRPPGWLGTDASPRVIRLLKDAERYEAQGDRRWAEELRRAAIIEYNGERGLAVNHQENSENQKRLEREADRSVVIQAARLRQELINLDIRDQIRRDPARYFRWVASMYGPDRARQVQYDIDPSLAPPAMQFEAQQAVDWYLGTLAEGTGMLAQASGPTLGQILTRTHTCEAGTVYPFGRPSATSSGIIRSGTNSRVVFDGMEVRGVRDLSHVSDSTLKQMAKDGFAAKDINAKALELHHLDQNPAGPVVEIPGFRHKISNEIQHPFGNSPGAGLTAEQRAAFDAWRVNYWKARAAEELARRGMTP